MARYRYRTPAVAGHWRDSREAALRDAVVAKQAAYDISLPGGIRWVVPGTVEVEEASAPQRLTLPAWVSRPRDPKT